MRTKLFIKLFVVLSLCLAVVFAFTGCKDDEVYAGSDDFQSYPDYWNDFNENGDIYIDPNGTTSNTQSGSSNGGDDTSSDDFTANFTEDDEEDESIGGVDTDKDGTPDNEDTDDDNDGITDDKDDDDNGNGTPDDEEKPDYGNQGPLVFF